MTIRNPFKKKTKKTDAAPASSPTVLPRRTAPVVRPSSSPAQPQTIDHSYLHTAPVYTSPDPCPPSSSSHGSGSHSSSHDSGSHSSGSHDSGGSSGCDSGGF